MEDERVVELVSAHADELIGRPEARQQIGMTDEESRQMIPLFQIAEQLHQAMQPIQPSAAFVHSLGKELVDNARRQAGLSKRLRRAVLIGAAAVGSLLSIASVVGAIIFVIVRWRERTNTSTAQAPTG